MFAKAMGRPIHAIRQDPENYGIDRTDFSRMAR